MDKAQAKQEAYESFCERGKEALPFFDKYPVIARHIAFDAGYDSRNYEVSKLRDLLRQSLDHVDSSFIVGSADLYEEILAELAKE